MLYVNCILMKNVFNGVYSDFLKTNGIKQGWIGLEHSLSALNIIDM